MHSKYIGTVAGMEMEKPSLVQRMIGANVHIEFIWE